MFVPAWDPTWGPEKKIYHLATPSFTNKNIPFWHRPTVLCENFKPIFITKNLLFNVLVHFTLGNILVAQYLRQIQNPQKINLFSLWTMSLHRSQPIFIPLGLLSAPTNIFQWQKSTVDFASHSEIPM